MANIRNRPLSNVIIGVNQCQGKGVHQNQDQPLAPSRFRAHLSRQRHHLSMQHLIPWRGLECPARQRPAEEEVQSEVHPLTQEGAHPQHCGSPFREFFAMYCSDRQLSPAPWETISELCIRIRALTYWTLRCLYWRMTSSKRSGLISINIFRALYTMLCIVLMVR